MAGKDPLRIVRPAARRLNTRIDGCAASYNAILEKDIRKHKLLEKLGEAHAEAHDKPVLNARVNKIDDDSAQYMRHAEMKCRKIKSGRIVFSPEASKWIRQCQVYRSLLRFHAGKICNRGNLKRAARRCGIQKLMHLSIQEIVARLEVCKTKMDHFRRHGRRYRNRHLRKRLLKAQDREDAMAESRILAIIQREKDRSQWKRINYAMEKEKGWSVGEVYVQREDWTTVTHNTESEVQDAIWNEIHCKRFYAVERAPICQGKDGFSFQVKHFDPHDRFSS